jgi:tetratricopeptide (TPR) repeat protein
MKKTNKLPLGFSNRIGYSFWQAGKHKEAMYYFEQLIKYDKEAIKLGRWSSNCKFAQYDLAGVYAFLGDKENAYQYLDEWNKKKSCALWWITLIKHDPLFAGIREEPRFRMIVRDVEAKYQAVHESVGKWIAKQGML